MEELIQTRIYALLVCGCLCSLIQFICVDSKIKNLVETGCACVMILVTVSLFSGSEIPDAINGGFKQWHYLPTNSDMQYSYEQAYKNYIESEYAAYILNEGRDMGIGLIDAEVSAEKDHNSHWIPISVIYRTDETITEAFQLHIENQLGIPKERQHTYETNAIDREIDH